MSTTATTSEEQVTAFLRTIDWEAFWLRRGLDGTLLRCAKLHPPRWTTKEGYERVPNVIPTKVMIVDIDPVHGFFVRLGSGKVFREEFFWDFVSDMKSGDVYVAGSNVYFQNPDDALLVKTCLG